MSLISEAEDHEHRQGGLCAVAGLRESLDDKGKAELAEALAAPITGTALAKALQNRGHKVAPESIQRHRRGDCQCRF